MSDDATPSFTAHLNPARILSEVEKIALNVNNKPGIRLAAAKILLDKTVPSLSSVKIDAGSNTNIFFFDPTKTSRQVIEAEQQRKALKAGSLEDVVEVIDDDDVLFNTDF